VQIPSAWDSRQADNAKKCSDLVLAVSSDDRALASQCSLDDFIAAAKDAELGDFLARALAVRTFEGMCSTFFRRGSSEFLLRHEIRAIFPWLFCNSGRQSGLNCR
jgi:hypothetical protein